MEGAQPIAVPTIPAFSVIPAGVSLESVLSVVITLIFIWWAVFTRVAAYHWFRYARDSWVAVPAFALHIAVSAWVFVFATGGFH